MEEDGRWITLKSGKKVFIKEGQSLVDALVRQEGKTKELTEEEKEAVDFWKEGNDGWGYQALKYASQDKLDDYEPIKTQIQNWNSSKANYMKEEYTKLYNNFKKALDKAPSVNSSTDLYRYENTYNVPQLNQEVTFNELDSFTFKPNSKMTEQFGGTDKVVYKTKGSKEYKDISNLGNAFTYEAEAIINKKKTYKVIKVEKKDFYGKVQYVVTLK